MKETPEEYAARKEREREEWEERQRDRDEARAEKRRIISKAESVASTNDFKSGSDELNALMAEWKAAGSAGRDYEADLWSDFHAARQRFFDRRKEYYNQRERERDKVEAKKRGIVTRAQSISKTSDFKSGHEELLNLRDEWKSVGRASKDAEEELYGAFRKAQDVFYERWNASKLEQSRERQENKARKTALVNRAQALASSTDFRAAADEFAAIQADWRAIKSAGREDDDALWNSFNAARQRFFGARKQYFDNRNREFAQRADKKRQIIARANSLLTNEDGKTARAQFVELRKAWNQIGSAGKEDAGLWQEFSAIGDTLFSKRLVHDPANAMQRLEKQIDQQFSKALRGEVERENRRASSSITGGYKPFGFPTGKVERHHSDPKEYGGANRQKLTPMDQEKHRAFHADDRAFRATKGWNKDTPRDRKLDIRADHYDLAKGKYPDASRDFFEQHPDQAKAARERNEQGTDFVRQFRPKKKD